MKKICLSIDQMRQFKELGVETKDASMCWIHLVTYNNSLNVSTDQHILSFNKPELYLAIGVHSKIDDRGAKEFIKDVTPAFTLQDMLEMMPKEVKGYDLVLFADNHIQYEKWSGYGPTKILYQVEGESLLETAFGMFIWLAKHGYLKGGNK